MFVTTQVLPTGTLRQTGCLGLCDQEPMLTFTDESGQQFIYGKLDRKKVQEIVRAHVIGEHPVIDFVVST